MDGRQCRALWDLPALIQMGYTMIVLGGLQVMGPSEVVVPLLVILIEAALLGFAWFAKSRKWLA